MDMANTKRDALFDVIQQFFKEDQWNFQITEKDTAFRAGYHGEHGTWICYAHVDEDNRRFLFYSLAGMNITPENRLPVIEYLNRVNCLLAIGNFELNFDTGDVRFKTAIEVPEGGLTVEMVRSLVYTNVQTMDFYLPGVVSIVHGGLNPAAALARIEAQTFASPQ